MTLQSVLQQIEGLSVGILFLCPFIIYLIILFLRLYIVSLHVVVGDWHAWTPPRVKFKRLKVWHLNTVPAGLMFTYTWCRTCSHFCMLCAIMCVSIRACLYVCDLKQMTHLTCVVPYLTYELDELRIFTMLSFFFLHSLLAFPAKLEQCCIKADDLYL